MKAMVLNAYGDNAKFELAELAQPSPDGGARRGCVSPQPA